MSAFRKYLFIIIASSHFYSCNIDRLSPGLNTINKFNNFITLEGKIFKDGDADFYPMVMNYSVDIINLDTATSSGFYATPRKGYHPNYGKGEGETMNPWERDSTKNHLMIKNQLASIKDMGFNTIRLTGFTPTDEYQIGFSSWSNIDLSNSSRGNENIKNGYIPLLKTILGLAEENGLRVILLLSAIETQPENQANFFTKVAKGLAYEKSLLAYDLFNEPIYFDRGEYTKKQTKDFVESYNKNIKDNAPNHLTTIGLTHYKIVYEWDPELMDVDFLSFHMYPYWSKNLSLLERFESKMYWVSNNITKPWIVGETGLNTPEECYPVNLASGTVRDQLYFMSYSIILAAYSGASGYSWWNYQDTRVELDGNCPHVSYYGLVNRKKGESYQNSKGETILGGIKHDITKLPFAKFANAHPYYSKYWNKIKMPNKNDYYNIDYVPDVENVFGKVVDENGDAVEDAIVSIYNPKSKSKYSTFTKPDGTFDLKTGWTKVINNLDLEICVTAVKMETRVITIRKIWKIKGNRNHLEEIALRPFSDS